MKHFLTLAIFATFVLLFPSCTEQAPKTTSNENLLLATLYHQKAAEMEALCLQAYNVAQYRLDEILVENPGATNLAIVLDLDETVLDNSPYEAKCLLEKIDYPTGWDEWMHLADAKAIPGAVDFLKYTQSKGVQIFYITNRKEKYRNATLQNLIKLDIAPASEAHLLLRTHVSSKEPRRQKVMKDYEIVMLFGDNLADFNTVFDGKNMSDRAAITDSLKTKFGRRYIVLPNAMYGDWVGAMYNNNYSLTNEQKIEHQYKNLEGF